jgi:hypothetical protein
MPLALILVVFVTFIILWRPLIPLSPTILRLSGVCEAQLVPERLSVLHGGRVCCFDASDLGICGPLAGSATAAFHNVPR